MYICTVRAVTEGLCSREQLGTFILDLPQGISINSTSFWSARVVLPSNQEHATVSSKGLWNNPEGNPTPPPSNYTSPWRRQTSPSLPMSWPVRRQGETSSGLYFYKQPIQYPVRKTGYYCVGKFPALWRVFSCFHHPVILAAVPVTVHGSAPRTENDRPYHPAYKGLVLFKNVFEGKLPATDYPKVNVCSAMSPSINDLSYPFSFILQ